MLKHKSLIFLAALTAACFTTANLMACTPDGQNPTGINDKTSNDTVVEEDTVDDDSVVDDSADGDSVVEDTNNGIADTSDSGADSAVEDSDSSPITWTECSGKPGEKACDFTFQDQNGNDWSLYDNYGTVMVVDFSTIWCAGLQEYRRRSLKLIKIPTRL